MKSLSSDATISHQHSMKESMYNDSERCDEIHKAAENLLLVVTENELVNKNVLINNDTENNISVVAADPVNGDDDELIDTIVFNVDDAEDIEPKRRSDLSHKRKINAGIPTEDQKEPKR